ncbi:hypothetical protein PO878_20210 [Iamia majanohamensis]|uniref:Integrase n=1 Tax=Iamia majanohamensis TaxID=467976 RepID=A0AAF0BVJ0_9ACTN|nr:hypothetical protein [Iamia majanohamensis]WCO66820.1 hypothetical protein PO878_20210 [Iamia majanohamensis]
MSDTEKCEPRQLPFDGTVPVAHRLVGRLVSDVGAPGRHLAVGWSHERTYPGILLEPRDVLATAATVTAPRLMEVIGLVGSHLGSVRDVREQSGVRLMAEIKRFALRLEASGVRSLDQVTSADCCDFIDEAVTTRTGGWSEPSVSTRYLRRSAIRLLFGTARRLQLATGDPTLDIALPPRPALTTRPLDDAEEMVGRVWAKPTLTGTRHAAAWALGQATATGSEQAAARVGDLDLERGRVKLHGNERSRKPRWGQLTDWGVNQLERRLDAIGTDPSTPLVTSARASRNARQASSCAAVSEVLRAAQLNVDRSVRPASLPAWAGRAVFDANQRIDEAAHALGVRSLDQAASVIGWSW